MRVYSSRVVILKFLPVIFCRTVNIILLCYKLILFYPWSLKFLLNSQSAIEAKRAY